MNTLEMQILFETLLQSASPAFNDALKPDTDVIFSYLNQAQVKVLKERYINLATERMNVTSIKSSLKDLKNLVKIVPLENVITAPYTHTLLFRPTTRVMYYMTVTGNVTRTHPMSYSNQTIDFSPMDAKLPIYLTTPLNVPLILTPVYTTSSTEAAAVAGDSSALLIVHDKYTSIGVGTVKAHCLVYPRTLVLSVSNAAEETTVCDLADHLHNMIVELAVGLFIGSKTAKKDKEEAK